MKKTIAIVILVCILCFSGCNAFSVNNNEMDIMNDFILCLRDENYKNAINLMHPDADPSEDGLKELVQGLKADNGQRRANRRKRRPC